MSKNRIDITEQEAIDLKENITEEEKNIILRHMWPLTPVPPATRAGYAVTMADKICGTRETAARAKDWILMSFMAQPAGRG